MTFHALIVYLVIVVPEFRQNRDFGFDIGMKFAEIEGMYISVSLKGFHDRLLLSESTDSAAVALYADCAEFRTPIVRFVPDVGKSVKLAVFAV